jgi:hypothetical protein
MNRRTFLHTLANLSLAGVLGGLLCQHTEAKPRRRVRIALPTSRAPWLAGENYAWVDVSGGGNHVGEVLAFDHALTQAQERVLSAYLRDKWGVPAGNQIL